MQLIRAINKNNKSNNNNNQSSSANKVVIVAPPPRSSAGHQQPKSESTAPAPVSPSVALPALKKRTSIVKQSVPPPVPPRGSPRSKSNNLISVHRTRNQKKQAPKPTINVERQLQCLSTFEQSGCQKVKQWLETVEIPVFDVEKSEISIPEQIEFKSVKKLVQTFALHEEDELAKSSYTRGQKVFDSSVVRFRVDSYNSLERDVKAFGKRGKALRSSDGGTDSGIDMPARYTLRHIDQRTFESMNRFIRNGEFV